jgi:histidinol-phosphate aminotransferase
MSDLSQMKPRRGIDELLVYEPGRPLEEVAREHGIPPDTLVKLASNENNLGPSPKAVTAMRDAAARMHLYPDGGAFYLRASLAAKLGVSPEMLIFGNGSNELIEFLGHVFLEPGLNIVMSQSAFIIYKLVAETFGAEARMAPMHDFTHDLEAMAGLVDDNTRLVFVANPNNPTGTRVDNEALKSFLEALPPHVLPVLDEAYVELLAPADQPDSLRWIHESRPLILLRTFSKTYGLAGLRLGYGVAHPELIQLLGKFRQPFNVNAMAQAAALAAIEDEDYVQRTRDCIRDGLEFFERSCAELGLETVPSCANFLLIKTGEGRKRFQQMQARGVITRPMDGYGLPDWLRVSVGTEIENQRALDVLREMC